MLKIIYINLTRMISKFIINEYDANLYEMFTPPN